MLIVQNSIISDDIADQLFACDLAACHGTCCIEGDSGAPLLESEIPILESILPAIEKFMTPEGIAAIQQQGVAVRDNEGDLGTPLCPDGSCAYISMSDGELALCAIECAYRQNLIPDNFPKPISCHLYPIRVDDYGEFTAVNYHRWDICRHACGKGQPLYKMLREPLIRRFGLEWYNELLSQIEESLNEKNSH